MKIFLWLSAAAIAVVCVACWAAAHVLVQSWYHKFAGVPVPYFTRVVLLPYGWLLLCPLIWVAYAATLSFRKDITPCAAFLFLGTAVLGIALIVSSVTIALLLPYVHIVDF
jgi:hypothetical protein